LVAKLDRLSRSAAPIQRWRGWLRAKKLKLPV
jgi:hypothetical protein